MPIYRTTVLIVALLAAPAALAADSPVPGAAPDAGAASEAAPASQPASSAPAPQPASPTPEAQPAAAAAAPAQTAQPPGAAASASVPPAHQVHIPPQHLACLAKSEVRGLVASHQVIPLGEAIQSVRKQGKRAEVVRARLCRHGDKLAYVLTLFGHSGKVFDVSVDAVSGDLIAGR